MRFTSHQGFLIFGRYLTIEGDFCRDHCIEAYQHSLGRTLKGMWFSPTSLLFGAISTVWDTAKLGTLPGEVLDEPWQLHLVRCPNCKEPAWRTAGSGECEHCNAQFAIASCVHCKHITVCDCEFEEAEIISCRICRQSTSTATSVRNSPQLIYCYALAEILTIICHPKADEQRNLLQQYVGDIDSHFDYKTTTLKHCARYFEKCADAYRDKYLESIVKAGQNDLVEQLILYASHSVQFSNDGTAATTSRFIDVLMLLGSARSAAESYAQVLFKDRVDWWTVLGVAANSPIETIKAAYLAESRKVHPDYSHGLPQNEQQANAERMKVLNQAFEAAKNWVASKCNDRNETAKTTRETSQPDNANRSSALTKFTDNEQFPSRESGNSLASNQQATEERPVADYQASVIRSTPPVEEGPLKSILIFSAVLLVLVVFAVILKPSKSHKPPGGIAPKPSDSLISDSDESDDRIPKMTDSKLDKETFTYPPPIESSTAILELPDSSYERGVSATEFLSLSDYPIYVKNIVYDFWYENIPGFSQRTLALQYIAEGYAYFIDENGRTVKHSILTITDKDLEKVVRYVGQGTGIFFIKIPEARSWTMSVSGNPVYASLVGILNRTVVLRWEGRREYIFVDLDRLAPDDQSYVLNYCR